MGSGRAIGIACRIYQRPSERLCRNTDVKPRLLGSDGVLATPRNPTVKRAVESAHIVLEIVPACVHLAIATDEGHCANAQSRSVPMAISPRSARPPMIGGCGHSIS